MPPAHEKRETPVLQEFKDFINKGNIVDLAVAVVMAAAFTPIVNAFVDGVLNDWRTRDQGWSAEFAIPLGELAEQGVPLDAQHPWRVLIGRYNYSAHLPHKELTMYPRLPKNAYHNQEHWARLVIQ